MLSWNHFIYFALPSVVLWAAGGYAAFRAQKTAALLLTLLGILLFLSFIVGLWISLERPPLRTMGETRLWYSFFLPVAGLAIWSRWQYRWILAFSTILVTVFIGVNLFKPEIHDTALMPALQSPWFVPHVIVYMFCYALFGAALAVAVYMLFTTQSDNLWPMLDNMVYVGLAFMTFGMLFGAVWAKEVWGHYWAWDPKETWAAVTWLAYLGYIHYRRLPFTALRGRIALWILIGSFCCLQMCWWGINYLPSAQGKSIHTYTMK